MKAKIIDLHPQDAFNILRRKYLGKVVTLESNKMEKSLLDGAYLRGNCKFPSGINVYFAGVKLDPNPTDREES